MDIGTTHVVLTFDAKKISDYREDGILNHLHLLVTEGSVEVSLFSNPVRFLVKGDYLDADRIGTVEFRNPSPDFSGKILLLKRKDVPLYIESLPRMPLNLLLIFANEQILHLNEFEFKKLLHAFTETERIDYSEHRYRDLMLAKSIQMFLMDLVDIVDSMERTSFLPTQTEPASMFRIFNDFAKDVYEYGNRNHPVSFYSDRLNITSQYLNKTVKALIGETASNFIKKHLVTNISYELLNGKKNIKQIADDFNFSSLAAFSSFVKHYLGKTVTEILRENGN